MVGVGSSFVRKDGRRPVRSSVRLYQIQGPSKRVCALLVPIPYSPGMEDHVFPERDRIVAGVREEMGA